MRNRIFRAMVVAETDEKTYERTLTERRIDDLPEGSVEPDTAVYPGPGRYMTRYRIRGGSLVNYVATARTESWAEEGWAVPSTVDAQ